MPALLERIFATLALWIERAGERRNLSDLDDHLLRDIGLPLHDARREAQRPFWEGAWIGRSVRPPTSRRLVPLHRNEKRRLAPLRTTA